MFGDYQKCIYKLVERALSELVSCGRLNNNMGYKNDRENNTKRTMDNVNNNVDRNSYSTNNLCDVEKRQLINNNNNNNNNKNNSNNNNNNHNKNKSLI